MGPLSDDTAENGLWARVNRGDLITAAVFMLIGAATVIGALRLPESLSELFDLRSPAFFPGLLGLLIIALAFRLGHRALRGQSSTENDTYSGASPDSLPTSILPIPEPAAVEVAVVPSLAGSPAEVPDPPRVWRLIGATTLTVIYAYAVFHVGYWVASSVALILMAILHTSAGLTPRRFAWLILTGLIAPGVVIETFRVFLAVNMPGFSGGY